MIEVLEDNSQQLRNEVENIYTQVKTLRTLRDQKKNYEDRFIFDSLIASLNSQMACLRAISIMERALAQTLKTVIDIETLTGEQK